MCFSLEREEEQVWPGVRIVDHGDQSMTSVIKHQSGCI